MAASAARATRATRATRAAGASAGRSAAPELTVIDRADRVRRVTPTAVALTLMVSLIAFAALSVQISLIHRQQHLDSIRNEINEIQLANKELRAQESRLQAPAEILRIARDELGMVEARPPELVTPAVESVAATPPDTVPGSAPTSVPDTTSTDG